MRFKRFPGTIVVFGLGLFLLACGPAPMESDMPLEEVDTVRMVSAGVVDRIDNRLNDLIPADASIEKLADGFH